MNSIIDPLTNKIQSIYSKKGRQLLRNYIKVYLKKRGGSEKSNRTAMEYILDPKYNTTNIDELSELFESVSIDDNTVTLRDIEIPPDDDFQLFQIKLNLSLFKGLGIHCNDCVPTTLKLLQLISQYQAVNIAHHHKQGINDTNIIEFLNKKYPNYIFDTQIGTTIEKLKDIGKYLKPGYGCILKIAYKKPSSGGHYIAFVKDNDDTLAIIDGQANEYFRGNDRINFWFTSNNIKYWYVVKYKKNPSWGPEIKRPIELTNQ